MSLPVRVALISAHPLWLEACRRALETLPRKPSVMTVVADSSLTGELVEALSSCPHLAVLSLDLPFDGLQLARTLRTIGYEGPVLVMCWRCDLPGWNDLAKSTVQGIISSLASLDELESSIYAAVSGQLPPLMQQYMSLAKLCSREASQQLLNTREKEILRLVARDMTDQEVAERLSLSVRTVNNHLRHIYARLQVRGRAGAVAAAITRGLISQPNSIEPSKSGDATK